MNLDSAVVILGEATQQNPAAQMWQMIGMFAIMGVMFYFAILRPQSKRAKEHAAMLKTVKQNDQITTSGGIVGTVVTVKDNTVVIRSADTKLEVLKSSVTAVDRSKTTVES